MEKQFQEVFPDLRIEGGMAELLDTVEVSRVSINKKKDLLRIYVVSHQWIHKKYIYQLERQIEEQLFSNVPLRVKIIERFYLSRQYTPENFLEVYRPSILLELKNHSVFLNHLFSTAEITFPETNKMHLVLVDSVVAKEREEELVHILEKIFCERCGFDLIVETEMRKPEGESRAMRNSELRIREEVRHVLAHTHYGEMLGEKEQNRMEEQAEAAGEQPKAAAAAKDGEAKKEKAADGGRGKGFSGGGRGSFKKGKGSFGRNADNQPRKSSNPDVLYGRDFEDESVEILKIGDEIGDVVIRGRVQSVDMREIRNERTIFMFTITDFTDTIGVKIFVQNAEVPELKDAIKKGAFIKVKGKTTVDAFDHDLTVMSVWGIKKITDFRTGRQDTSPVKRVELHCHTKMSDMDGVTDAARLVQRAYEWGHPAIAITDHGVVQSFPEANHAIEAIDGAYRKKYQAEHPDATKDELKKVSAPFKVIYGMEAYLVDDLKDIVVNSKGQDIHGSYVVFDIETTGFSPVVNKIIEIGAVRVENGAIVDKFSTFVNPKVPIPFRIENLTGINDNMVLDAPDIETVLPKFLEFSEGAVMVAHNASFDMSFIEHNCVLQGIEREFTTADTVAMARFLLPGLNRFKLDTVAKAVGVSLENHHRAVDDAGCTAEIFVKFVKMLEERNILTLDDLNAQGKVSEEAVRKLPSYHAIILAKNETGRVNLYRLVSESHLKYYNRRPKLPKSVYLKYQDGLMIGSACEAGELYQAILRGEPDAAIARLVDFYDYLEIQPIGNNAFMIKKEDVSAVESEEDLKEINRRIVKLGEQFHKPVVATCDVHFMDPQDEIYRRIIMTGKGFDDADEQAPLFLRTTEEMLEEFSYLGSEKAEEVVITNPRKISDLVEKISPIRAGKFPPVIEDSDKTLRRICYDRAHEIYGEELPEIVSARLERELNSIISNGYAVMYIIAQKLVWKSNEDGYLVGSRGSVGSSFVATMAGITEVNPLSPHYYCESCHYSEFDSPRVKEYVGRAGCDMPDAVCPNCGKPLKKAGFDIPFETFLGFKGNKEPDIDLNFSGDYQSKAHKYTEVIFGKGQTFRAGTIAALAEKTAYGYVKNYYEERGDRKRNCEIDRIVAGCTGIRRSTGQHPGGIVVLPHGEDINSFTPIQHPANDMTTDIITTHFDYHSIDHNLLKLDILGHDDPTMIKTLEELINSDAMDNKYDGVNNVFKATDIPLDDPGVMGLFAGTEVLGITPEDIDGCPLGCLGVPEFGTDFVIQMVIDTKPKTLSDLIRISGLSHGTDVWLNNAQTLIEEGKATISTAICTRDDIMTYLINKGVESEESFTIMERVRKGTVAKGKCKEWSQFKKDMLEHDVPEWYIWSCERIKYMFPKAHAAAYVMMAYRIAYCKINYPLAYYAAYFGIRASAFSYELMGQGKEKLLYHMKEYKRRAELNQLSKKDQDTLKDMKNVLEMYDRGFDFLPIDIYKTKASKFQIGGDKLLPPCNTIDGMGDKAAEAMEIAAKDGPYLSKDDFRQRTKVSKTLIDLMADMGLLGDLPETNQLSLFDFA